MLAADGRHANAQLVLGLLLMKRGRVADARDAFLAAIASEPLLAKAHYQVSLAYTRLGDEAAARKHLRSVPASLKEMEQRLNKVRVETGSPSRSGTAQ